MNEKESVTSFQKVEFEEVIKVLQDSKDLTQQEFDRIKQEFGFNDSFKGTSTTQGKEIYLYEKHGFETDKTRLDRNLTVLRHLTKLGVVYPETNWVAYQNNDITCHIVAITPALETWNESKNGIGNREVLKKFSGPVQKHTEMFEEDSHILKWIKQVNPKFDPNDRNSMSDTGIELLLNLFEASHPDNWAWDSQGKLYPIDIEVLNISDESNQLIVDKIYDQLTKEQSQI